MKRKRGAEFQLKNNQRKVKINFIKVMLTLEKNRALFPAPPSYIDVVLVSNKKITEINKQFLHKNTPTDILSFKLSSQTGELIISAEMAAENAKRYDISTEYEVLYLIIHGYLHLKNYTDYTDKDREKMFKIQNRIFDRIIKMDEKDEKQ